VHAQRPRLRFQPSLTRRQTHHATRIRYNVQRHAQQPLEQGQQPADEQQYVPADASRAKFVVRTGGVFYINRPCKTIACMHACMHTKESPTLRTQMLTGCLCPPAAGGSWAGAAWPASQQSFDPSAAAPEQPPCTGGVMSKYGQPATQRGLPAWLCKHAAVHLIHLVQCSHLASTSTPIMTHIIHAAAPPPPHPTPLTHP
jgi:hypothetical protein